MDALFCSQTSTSKNKIKAKNRQNCMRFEKPWRKTNNPEERGLVQPWQPPWSVAPTMGWPWWLVARTLVSLLLLLVASSLTMVYAMVMPVLDYFESLFLASLIIKTSQIILLSIHLGLKRFKFEIKTEPNKHQV